MDKTKKNDYIVTALLVLSVVLIATALFFGKEAKRAYNFEVGKPWLYPRLEADFQFDIELDDATRKQISDSVDQNFAKIYSLDRKKGEQQCALLYRAVAGHTGGPALVNAVSSLYSNGIVDDAAANDIRAGKQIRFLVGNNQLQVVDSRNMKTATQAYAWLADSLRSNAALQEALHSVEINRFLVPNMTLNADENEKWLGEARDEALRSHSLGTVLANEVIITRGEKVTKEKAAAINSYQNELAKRTQDRKIDLRYNLAGQVLIVAVLMLAFFYFMKWQRNQVFASTRRMVFLISFITVFAITVFVLVRFKYNLLFVIPFGLVPIIVSSFFDDHTSFFVLIVTVLICSLVATTNQAEFIIMQSMAGLIAILAVKGEAKRTQLVRCAVYILASYCIIYIAMMFINGGTFSDLDYRYFGYFAINCVILSFAFLVIPVVEKFFGFTSSITLLELADINSPLLRKLSTTCPGTFQHSLQVANLAGEAALRIGADMQLARTGALYHDIGKIKNPAFFTENQNGTNPHDHLTRPEDSANIIIKHVADGLKLASEADLPHVVKDLIAQHHGKGLTRYFYDKAVKARPNAVIDKALFAYPGPNPQTKEAAILMMADACEAATKSLSDHSDEAIAKKVTQIIDGQSADGLFKEAPISFRDVETVKQLLIERLCTAYHTRVAYPADIEPLMPKIDTSENTAMS